MTRTGGIAVAAVIVAVLMLSGKESTTAVLDAEAVATTVKVLPLAIVTSYVRDALSR
jgi:hypothetical protein